MAEPKLTIAGREYLLSSLSPEARSLCAQLQYCDERANQLQLELAVLNTARQATAQALVNLLPPPAAPAQPDATPAKAAGKAPKTAASAATKKTARSKVH